jgi:microcystin-dependent protein
MRLLIPGNHSANFTMSIAQAGVYWPFKTLLQGSGISIVEDATTVRITNTGGTGGGSGDMLSSQYATNGQPGVVDKAVTAENVSGTVANATNAAHVPWTGVTGTPTSFPSDWSVITSKPTVFPPTTHGPTHLPGGTDQVPIASANAPGWLAQLSGNATDYVGGDNACHALSGVPSGSLSLWAGISSSPPGGWLLCDGSAVSRTLYANLFNVVTIQITGDTTAGNANVLNIADTTGIGVGMPISGPVVPAGTTVKTVAPTSITMSQNATLTQGGVALVVAPYGVGDGNTTFNLPDFRGRTPIGAGQGTGLTNRIRGQKLGEENHLLSVAELASHAHSASAAVSDPHHSHGIYYTHAGGTGPNGLGDASPGGAIGVDYSSAVPNATSITVSVGISANGSSASHNNMQPFAVINFIVKT